MIRLAAAIAAATIAVAACAPSATTPPATAAPRGGTLTFAIYQEPETLNPFYATQTVSTVVSETILEGLSLTDPDGDYVPVLAKEVPTIQNGGVKVSADAKRMDVTYKLLDGVTWSDGTPFTSADVKFTWERRLKDPKVTLREGYDLIDSVDTPDLATVVLHYKEIYAPYATRFGVILPKHVLERFDDMSKSDFGRKPMGTGPFKIVEFVSGDHITVERNPNYRVKDKPILDRIVFKVVPSREVATAQLKAGDVDGMWDLIESQIPELEKDASIRLAIVTTSDMERLVFNLARRANPADPNVAHPVLGDVNVRRALLLATPKQQLIDKLLFGKVKLPGSFVTIGWAAPKDLRQENYDPAKAKQLLDQAGWVPGPDGIRGKGGVRAKLEINTTSGVKLREQVEQILVDEWKAIGVELTIKNMPSSVFFGSWSQNGPRKKGDFDVYMYTTGPGIDPHQHISQHFHCKNIPQVSNNGAGTNYFRFCNDDLNKLVEQAGATVEQEKRRQLYRDALKIVNDNVLGVWLYTRGNIDAFRTNVGGWKLNGWDNITWSVEDWFVRR